MFEQVEHAIYRLHGLPSVQVIHVIGHLVCAVEMA
jgi:hypothetical protein